MKQFTKWLSLVLALVMCASIMAGCVTTPDPTTTGNNVDVPNPSTPVASTPIGSKPTEDPNKMTFTGSPTLEGDAADRLPVAADVFVSQYDATGATLEIGTYGGSINLGGANGSWDLSRPTLETIIRRNADGSYYANVIKSFEYSEDYKVWTFHLREGMKWSDGDDFNADDITFWYYMCHINNYDTKASWAALKDGNGEFAKLEKVDDYTVTWTFGTPKFPADFIENGDFKWCWAPSHWLKDLIPASYYVENPYWENTNLSDEDVLKNAQAKGVDKTTVKDLGKEVAYYFWNVGGMPTVNSFVLRAGESRNDTVCHMDRNAYY